MKFEVDLNDIFCDENGSETLSDSIRRQVVENVQKTIEGGIKDKINRAIAETIEKEIQVFLKKELPALFENVLDAKFLPVSSFGSKGEPTSVREELIKAVQKHMVYEKDGYGGSKNTFTKTVDAVVESKLSVFKNDFKAEVDRLYTQETLLKATEVLKTRLGIK